MLLGKNNYNDMKSTSTVILVPNWRNILLITGSYYNFGNVLSNLHKAWILRNSKGSEEAVPSISIYEERYIILNIYFFLKY